MEAEPGISDPGGGRPSRKGPGCSKAGSANSSRSGDNKSLMRVKGKFQLFVFLLDKESCPAGSQRDRETLGKKRKETEKVE